MKPYLSIDEREWKYIKETFDKQDVKESLAKVAMTYEIPYALISENDAYKALMKLKGMRHNEILVDGTWFASNSRSSFAYYVIWRFINAFYYDWFRYCDELQNLSARRYKLEK